MPRLSAIFAPGPRTLEYALHAEALGYDRAWVYDSPGLYWNCWPSLAQLASGTRTIGLGVATLVPAMHHPVSTAGAALAIDQMAPGRLALSVGTGFTGRRVVGKRPHSWKVVEQYTRTVRALLAGEDAEFDGSLVRCLHQDGSTRLGSASIPLLVAANGPKGLAVAERAGDGVISIAGPIGGFDWSAFAVQGTVLDADEAPTDPAVTDRLASGLALQYHVAYEMGGPDAVDQLPGGQEWRREIESIPEERRHLAIHEGHVTAPPDWEKPFLHEDLVTTTFTGPAKQIAEKAEAIEQAGVTELIYTPLGPDIHRELRAMADALGTSPG